MVHVPTPRSGTVSNSFDVGLFPRYRHFKQSSFVVLMAIVVVLRWDLVRGNSRDVQMDRTDRATLQLSRLREGEYVFLLTVYDESGQRDQDNVTVQVLPGMTVKQNDHVTILNEIQIAFILPWLILFSLEEPLICCSRMIRYSPEQPFSTGCT